MIMLHYKMNFIKNKVPNERYKSWHKKLIMRPESIFSVIWEIFMTIILLAIAVILPYSSAFESTNYALSNNLDILSVTVFSIDIILNFSTGYYEEGNLIMDRTKIAKHYFKLWFWIDFFSAIPFSLILNYTYQNYSSNSQMLGLFKLLRVSRLFKLVKLARLKVLISRIEDHMSNEKLVSTVAILKLLFYLFLIAHLFACIMFSVSLGDLSPSTMAYQMATKSDEIIESQVEFYVASLYWAFVTMASIGYGDISPQNINEKIFGVIAMLTTSVIFGVIIGNIGSLTEKYNRKETLRREALLGINKFMKKHNLAGKIRHKAQNYIDFAFRNDKLMDSNIDSILCNLSNSLQEEIFLYSNGNAIKKCPPFGIFTEQSIYRISKTIDAKIFSPMDPIINESQNSLGMFFILHGLVEVYDSSTSRRITVLTNKNYFGEIGLFTRQPCVASVVSVHFTETLFLSFIEFDKLVDLIPTIKEKLNEIKESCAGGNYTALGVQCYSCQELGHIAKHCRAIINEDKVRQKWITRRFHCRLVSEDAAPSRKHQRYLRSTKNHHYGVKNVLGIKRKIGHMYNGFRGLIRRIKYHFQEYSVSGSASMSHTEESGVFTSTYRAERHLEWILDTEESK